MTDVKKQYFIGKKGASLGKASIFVKIALLLIVVIMLVMSVNMLMRYGELQDQKDALEAQVKMGKDKVEELEYMIDAPMDKDYIVRVAREKLGLVLPEEIVYYSDIVD